MENKQKDTKKQKVKEMFIKALERVEELNAKGYKLTDSDKSWWWEDFKAYYEEVFKDAQRRTPSDDTTEGFVHLIIGEVACHETETERQIEQGKAFAERNKTVFDVAMAVAKFYNEQLQLRMDAYARERKALSENKELRERIGAYHDKTLITADFLIRNGFKKREYDFHYSDKIAEITAQNIDSKAGIWRIEVAYLDDGYPQQLDICTVGQLRMFLAIQGINLKN